MTEPRSEINEVKHVHSVRGIRGWLRTQGPLDRSDYVGSAARVFFKRTDGLGLIEKFKIDTGKGGTEKYRRGLRTILEQHRAELSPEEVFDCTAALNHWDEIVAEWRIDAAAAAAMKGAKGMSLVGVSQGDAAKMVPSVEMPLPVARCVFPRCGKTAVYGQDRCEHHGGEWMEPLARQAMLLTAHENLVSAAGQAVETLVNVMVYSRRDDARVAAAREVLDRVGIRPDNEIHLHVHDAEEASTTVAAIHARLDEMKESIEAGEEIKKRIADDIIDAEEIEEDG